MPIRKRNTGWQVDAYAKNQFWPQGRRVRVQCEGDLAEAKILEAQIIADLRSGREPSNSNMKRSALVLPTGVIPSAPVTGTGAHVTLKQLVEACMQLRPQWAQGRNQQMLKVNTADLLRILGSDRIVAQIDVTDVDKLTADFNRRQLATVTRNNKYSVLSTLMKFAEERGWGRRVKVPIKKPGKGRTRTLSADEEIAVISKLVELGYVAEADYVQVMIETGCRPGELFRLEVRDWDGTMLKIWETKTNEPRSVAATPKVRAVLNRRAEGAKKGQKIFADVTRATLRRSWEMARKELGFSAGEQFVVYALRHTCFTRMIEKNVNPLILQKWAGHSDLSTTKRYVQVNDTMLLAAAAALAGEPVPVSDTGANQGDISGANTVVEAPKSLEMLEQ